MYKIKKVKGVLLSIIIGIISFVLSPYLHFSAVVIAIIIGIIVGNFFKPNDNFKLGIDFSEKHFLSIAIALMGVNLNFHILNELGIKSLALVIVSIALTIISSIVLTKVFSCNKRLTLLLGIGNGVCGSSAIAATEKIIGAEKEDVGLSVAIVNFLGTIGIFLLPFIASVILNISDTNSGILIGNTLQAVGQVVAAGFSLSHTTGHIATIVKMTRILMLFPLIIILIVAFSNKSKSKETKFKRPKMPIFIIGFVLFSLIPSFNLLSDENIDIIGHISHYFLIVAMAAIGLKITIQSILQNGKQALYIGSIIFLIQILFSSFIIYFLF